MKNLIISVLLTAFIYQNFVIYGDLTQRAAAVFGLIISIFLGLGFMDTITDYFWNQYMKRGENERKEK